MNKRDVGSWTQFVTEERSWNLSRKREGGLL